MGIGCGAFIIGFEKLNNLADGEQRAPQIEQVVGGDKRTGGGDGFQRRTKVEEII